MPLGQFLPSPYRVYSFVRGDLGGRLMYLLNGKRQAVLGQHVSFYLGGGILNSTGRKESVHLDDHVALRGWLVAEGEGRIAIGAYTTIHPRTFIKAQNSVMIGRYCKIASDVVIEDTNDHSTNAAVRRQEIVGHMHRSAVTHLPGPRTAPIHIGDDVWVGRRAMIYKGVTIGNGAIIAAGAVVTHDVPPYTIAAGNPARIVKSLQPSEDNHDSHARHAEPSSHATL